MSSAPAIYPNPNVDSAGRSKPLPSADVIANETFNHVCAVLEVIAAILHHHMGGTTSSTTTLGLISETRLLLLTSQQNKRFDDVTPKMIHDWIDELSKVDYQDFLKHLKLDHVYKLTSGEVQHLQSRDDKDSKELVQSINFVYYNLYPSFVRLQAIKTLKLPTFEFLKSRIAFVEVITNDQLISKGTVTSGLHGEGRFVRYCYIRYVANLALLDYDVVGTAPGSRVDALRDKKNPRLQPPGAIIIPHPPRAFAEMQPVRMKREHDPDPPSDEDEAEAGLRSERERMVDHYFARLQELKKHNIQAMQIFVASSQGTCNDCQKMLSSLDIAHNTHRYSKESDSANWVDPFTWKDKNSASPPSPRLGARLRGEMLAEQEFAKMSAKKTAKTSEKEKDVDKDEKHPGK